VILNTSLSEPKDKDWMRIVRDVQPQTMIAQVDGVEELSVFVVVLQHNGDKGKKREEGRNVRVIGYWRECGVRE
jgi:hypothetical protein